MVYTSPECQRRSCQLDNSPEELVDMKATGIDQSRPKTCGQTLMASWSPYWSDASNLQAEGTG